MRAIHILASFGSGEKYTPYKCQPSSLQQLRAHQGFKERLRMLRSTWARGITDDTSLACICSAALFEELTTGWTAGVEVLNQAFSTVLPGKLASVSSLYLVSSFLLIRASPMVCNCHDIGYGYPMELHCELKYVNDIDSAICVDLPQSCE